MQIKEYLVPDNLHAVVDGVKWYRFLAALVFAGIFICLFVYDTYAWFTLDFMEEKVWIFGLRYHASNFFISDLKFEEFVSVIYKLAQGIMFSLASVVVVSLAGFRAFTKNFLAGKTSRLILTVVPGAFVLILSGKLLPLSNFAFDYRNVYGHILSSKLIVFCVLVFAVPLFEELVLRYSLFGFLRKKLGFWYAAVPVSLIGGALQYKFGVGAMLLYGVFFNLILCYTYENTKTILTPVLIKMLLILTVLVPVLFF